MCCYAKRCSEYFTALILSFQRLPHRADDPSLPTKQTRPPSFRKSPFFVIFLYFYSGRSTCLVSGGRTTISDGRSHASPYPPSAPGTAFICMNRVRFTRYWVKFRRFESLSNGNFPIDKWVQMFQICAVRRPIRRFTPSMKGKTPIHVI